MKRLMMLVWFFSCNGMEYNGHRRGSYSQELLASKTINYFLGSPSLSINLQPSMSKKMKESDLDNDDIWDMVKKLDDEPSLSDSGEMDLRLKALRKLVASAVEDVLKEKNENVADAILQLQIKDKELRQEKYKLYGALAVVGGTALTSIATIATVILSSQFD